MVRLLDILLFNSFRAFKIIWIAFLFLLLPLDCLATADFEVDGIYYRLISVDDLTCVVSHPQMYPSGAPIEPLKFEFRPMLLDGEVYVGSDIDRPGFDHYKGNVIIPETITYKNRTLKVIGIDSEAFRLCKKLLTVTIPSSVRDIGDYAFYGCISLKYIEGTLKASIGRYAFAGCMSLSKIVMKGGSYISAGAFMFCSSLTNVTVPNTVLQIGEGAFADCQKLSDLRLEDGTRDLSIYSYVCGNLHDDGVKSYTIKKLYVGRNIFYDPHTCLGSIADKPFKNVEELIIGDFVETLKRGVAWVGELDKNRVEATMGNPFDVTSLTKIVIGKAMVRMPSFEKARLGMITIRCNRPPAVDGQLSMYAILNATVIVPKGTLSLYKNAAPWKDFDIYEY